MRQLPPISVFLPVSGEGGKIMGEGHFQQPNYISTGNGGQLPSVITGSPM